MLVFALIFELAARWQAARALLSAAALSLAVSPSDGEAGTAHALPGTDLAFVMTDCWHGRSPIATKAIKPCGKFAGSSASFGAALCRHRKFESPLEVRLS